MKRYFQFFLLLLSAGAIYPLIYLRQNFEISILSAFGISADQLGHFYTMLGVVYAVTYLPSGWLADRFSPRLLISFSLAVVGLLGLWFSTYPGYDSLNLIFMGWGLSAGLTFWASLLKGVKLLAKSSEQGRFFGILDGGRGLVEALLATVAVWLFAAASDGGAGTKTALQPVIYMYSFTCLVIALLVFIFLKQERESAPAANDTPTKKSRVGVWSDLKTLAAIPRLWLLAIVILCGYSLFWATYSFSAYLQEGYAMTAVAASVITVTKLWMRPIGGIGAGFLGDRFGNGTILSWSMLFASLGLIVLAYAQLSWGGTAFVLFIVLMIGVMTYAVRGLYWAILESCHVPESVTGLAIGVVSVIAYSPDIFLPMINKAISQRYPGVQGYQIYFCLIALCGLLGTAIAFYLTKSSNRSKLQS